MARKCKNRKGAVSIECLPQEILTCILLKLPAETLYKFRSVCKLWYDIINDSQFINNHLLLSKPGLIFQGRNKKKDDAPAIFFLEINHRRNKIKCLGHQISSGYIYIDDELEIKASCNGLVLIGNCSKEIRVFGVANPITKQWLELPRPRVIVETDHHLYGFAYGGKYKVVWLFKDHTARLRCEILIIGSDLWREVQVPNYEIEIYDYPTSAGGVLYWMSADSRHKLIVSMEVAQENFQEIEFPRGVKGTCDLLGMGEYPALLHQVPDVQVFPVLDLWILEDFRNKVWIKKYSINRDQIGGLYPLTTIRNGEVIIFEGRSCLFTFDVKLKTLKAVTTHLNYVRNNICVFAHVNSLVPLRWD